MKPIQIWEFYEAPEEYQRLSQNGGDEDYIAHVPAEWDRLYYLLFAEGTAFGCCTVEEHELPDGSRIFIGCHA